MPVGGVRVPDSGRGLSTDASGRYADTTVSPPVTEAACHITTPRMKAGGVCRCFTGCPPRDIPEVVSLGEETPRSGTRRCKEHKI
jgi:hypothetical protein